MRRAFLITAMALAALVAVLGASACGSAMTSTTTHGHPRHSEGEQIPTALLENVLAAKEREYRKQYGRLPVRGSKAYQTLLASTVRELRAGLEALGTRIPSDTPVERAIRDRLDADIHAEAPG